MTGGRRRRWRVAVALALALYAGLVCLSPALHHDFACHMRSATHCTACLASPTASRLDHAPPLHAARLPDAGQVEAARPAARDAASPHRIPGRSPPA